MMLCMCIELWACCVQMYKKQKTMDGLEIQKSIEIVKQNDELAN